MNQTEPISKEPEMLSDAITPRSAKYFGAAALYTTVMALTTVMWPGDTLDYCQSVLLGPAKNTDFIDFGHLFWRPLGVVLYDCARKLVFGWSGVDQTREVWRTLVAFNWICGLACILSLTQIFRCLGVVGWQFWASLLGFCTSFGFLNYAHSGSSYIPALAMFMLGLALLTPPGPVADWRALLAGCLCALSVGFWATFITVVPVFVVYPLIGGVTNRRCWWTFSLVAAALALVGSISFGSGALVLGIHDAQGMRAWINESSHGITHIGGFPRALFGLPRSFVAMGNDGILFKRYLLKDPYAPTTLASMVAAGVVKLGVFYFALMATILGLWSHPVGRRLLTTMILAGAPVMTFAVLWQGGDAERYLALYPFLFSAWGICLSARIRHSWLIRLPILTVMLLMVATNLTTLSQAGSNARKARMLRRASEVLAINAPDRRLFVIQNDELAGLPFEMTLDPKQRRAPIILVASGHDDTPRWRERFAQRVMSLWKEGVEVWISRRPLSTEPNPDWHWAEGDDPRLKWQDFPQFFKSLEFGRTVGGKDGFLLLPRTERNEQFLANNLKQSNME